MSFYQRFREEIAAGGSVEKVNDPEAARSARITGLIMVGLLIFLGVKSPWTFLFVIGLLISVFLHEVGHFSTARLTGMKATQFFMGFGPRVWSKRKGEVEYGVRALPLGAFVRIIGMNNVDEVAPEDEPRAYRSQTFPRRLLVITAGSIMHMLIAFVLLFGVFITAGREQSTGIAVVQHIDTEHGSARNSGIQVGDRLISIDGAAVSSYDSITTAIRSHKVGDTISFVISRDGTERILSAQLGPHPTDPTRPYFGIGADDWGWKKLSVVTSATQSVADIGGIISDSVRGVTVALNPMNSIRHLTNQDNSLETRPTTLVGASQVSGSVGESDGLKGIVMMLASLNVFVGVFNMFPLLPFDGGHAAIAIYERIRSRKGRRYSADINKMVPVATLVVGLLGFLLLVGLYLDVTQPLG